MSLTVEGLLSNEDLRQREFPVTRDKVFLAHAGVCPLPQRVVQAVSDYMRECGTGDQERFVYPDLLDEGRKLVAQMIHSQPEEVAFVGPTSLALSLLASGLKFRRSDNILVCFDDFPSNVYPWTALAEQGVEVRLMNTRELGLIRARDVMGQVDENTRLVALASCHFISGYRIDIPAIGRFLRERRILFCVDAIQTLGAFPTTVEHVDMLAADAHKWMLGPCGAGVLYVRREVQERINPPIYGWHNVRCPDFVAQERITFQSDARKYEAGTHNLPGIVGMIAAVKLLSEVGIESVAAELLRKRSWIVPALQAKGYSVLLGDAPPENASGIVSFFKPGWNPAELHRKLAGAGIHTTLRVDRKGRRFLRLAPHFYNTDAEVQRAMDLV